jgi:transcription elongation GreA/GreB family factor
VKRALKRELLAALEASLRTLKAAHADALEGATHAEARPENDKDTRALEQSYLARGQAARVEALEAGLAAVKALATTPARGATAAAALGSLVEAEEDGGARRYYLAPEGGGLALTGGVQVVTPRSPLGQALLGRRAGEEVEVRLAGRARLLEVTRVR